MKKALIILIPIIIIILFLIAAYFGFIPGVSAIFMKQVDLGVTSDPALVEAMHQETGYKDMLDANSPTSSDLEFTGELEIDRQFTNAEITSYINDIASKWEGVPYRNVQVKANDDGTIESSAMINISRALSELQKLGYSSDQLEQVEKYTRFLPEEVPIYAVVSGSVENNQISLDVIDGKAGNIPVPSKYFDQIESALIDVAEKEMMKTPTLDIESIQVQNGNVAVQGTFPSQVSAAE